MTLMISLLKKRSTLALFSSLCWSFDQFFFFVALQKPVNGVGINPTAEKNCVDQGSKVELPFRLANELCQRNAVSVLVPACFDEKTRLEIQADPACVDLRSRSPYL